MKSHASFSEVWPVSSPFFQRVVPTGVSLPSGASGGAFLLASGGERSETL